MKELTLTLKIKINTDAVKVLNSAFDTVDTDYATLEDLVNDYPLDEFFQEYIQTTFENSVYLERTMLEDAFINFLCDMQEEQEKKNS